MLREGKRFANSREDEKPPVEYEKVADNLGKTLSTVTIDSKGQITDRTDHIPMFDFGTGGLVVPLPPKPVRIGSTWHIPSEVSVRLKDGTVKRISTREHYKLTKVATGVATVTVSTQVLTPRIDARVRSQLIQRLSFGEIKFDIDAGRVLSKSLDWDESIVGFNGPESNMKYRAQFKEQLKPSDRVARKS